MSSAATLRRQIEATLANRIPSALTPVPRTLRLVAATGIQTVDELLEGGLPLGAITEVVGSECSGRSSFALSFLAQITQAEKVCAWIDVSDTLDPESATAVGVDLSRLLWVRCGAEAATPVRASAPQPYSLPGKSRIDRALGQALRATDLLLQGGGFSAIVFDMGGIAPEFASRVPSATWFRYRAAAERTQASILLLTQHPCAKSSVELQLRLQPGRALRDVETVFTGIEHEIEVMRRRFTPAATNLVPLRKPPQRATPSNWESRTAWAGQR